jgi:hypothetical protein
MAKLRKFNNEEKEIAQRIFERTKSKKNINDAKVTFIHEGNFTIATVQVGAEVFSAVSKYNPFDHDKGILEFNPQIGERIALSRALHQI